MLQYPLVGPDCLIQPSWVETTYNAGANSDFLPPHIAFPGWDH